MKRMSAAVTAHGVLIATLACGALAEPMPAAMPPAIPAPQDTAYPGIVRLAVDATDTMRGIFRVHETIPVTQAGETILLFPKWLPGNHSPTGQIDKFAGLVIHAGGKPVRWTRDPVDVYAFHVDVPNGATAIDLDFQSVSPVDKSEGRVVMTQEMLNVQWDAMLLYPAGYFSRRITFQPSVKLPEGWKFGCALDGASTAGATTSFKPVALNTLVDSPMIAGKYFERVDLDPSGPVPVHMDIVADEPHDLEITPEELEAHRNLVQQAYRTFGSHHYDHYDFLFSLSSRMSGIGLEHHRSSEDGTTPKYFRDWDKSVAGRDLLAHEFTHSWNGKFRRPADLWTPNFNVPMRDSLLWVYEGQTQFWGIILATRSGLFSKEEGLDALAEVAADYANQAGREWRPLEDTTNDPIIAERRPIPWRSWQRSEDYYREGLLIWLDADTLIREKTGGQKSLDDFARAFFGVDNGSYVTETYTFDDIVKALNGVLPYDWAGFLHARLDQIAPVPLDGITRGGYKLVYTETPGKLVKSAEGMRKSTDLSFSLGMVLDKTGNVTGVQWNGPAFQAGITVGAQIVAVNDVTYDGDGLKDAITDAKGGGGPIRLLLKRGEVYRSVDIAYHGGLRYPHLERTPDAPALLDDLLAAKK